MAAEIFGPRVSPLFGHAPKQKPEPVGSFGLVFFAKARDARRSERASRCESEEASQRLQGLAGAECPSKSSEKIGVL